MPSPWLDKNPCFGYFLGVVTCFKEEIRIGSDMRSLARLLARHGTLPSRTLLLHLLQGEMAAFDACLTFARARGLDEPQLVVYEPQPTRTRLCDFRGLAVLLRAGAPAGVG